MKKLLVIILGTFLLNTAMMFLPILGQGEFTVNAEDVSDMNFNVKNLTLDGGAQKASYFSKEPNAMSPIVRFIMNAIEFATKIMGSIAVILYIISGFMYMTSQGNQQDLDKAKDVFKYTTIGLIVAFSSYLITLFVQSIFYTSVA